MRQEMLCTMPQRVELEIANPSEVQGTITRSGSTINISSYLNKKSLLRGDIVKLTKSSNITYPTTYEGTTPKAWGCKVTIKNKTSEVNGEVSYTVPSPRDLNTLTASVTKVPGYTLPQIKNDNNIAGSLNITKADGSNITSNSIIYLGEYVYFQHIPTDKSNYGYMVTLQNSAGTTIKVSGLYRYGIPLSVANSSIDFALTSITYSNMSVTYNSNIELYADMPGSLQIPSGSKLLPIGSSDGIYYLVAPKTVAQNNKTYICRFMWINRSYTSSGMTNAAGSCSIDTVYFSDWNNVNKYGLSVSPAKFTGVGNFSSSIAGTATICGRWLEENCPYYTEDNVLRSKTINSGSSYSFVVLSKSSYNTIFEDITAGDPLIVVTGTCNSKPFKVELCLDQSTSLTYGNIQFYKSGTSLYLKINNTFSANIPYSIGAILIYDCNYSSLTY